MSRALICAVLLAAACTGEREFFPGGGDAALRSPCTERYGGQNGFQLCFELGTECGFEAAKNPGQSCDQICVAGGGRCLRAYGNESTMNPCVALSEPPDGCTRTDHYDDICVCSL